MTAQSARKLPPRLDPVLPLPAGTGLSPLKQGEGAGIFAANGSVKVVELSYRAFFAIWEQVELRAAQNYPRYVGGPMDDIAQTWLEAAHAFRSAATPTGDPLPVMDEARAKKARTVLAKYEADQKKIEAAKKRTNGKAPAEPAAEAAPEPQNVPQRCREVHDADEGPVRCRGPLGHVAKKHKGKTKSGKVVSWTSDG